MRTATHSHGQCNACLLSQGNISDAPPHPELCRIAAVKFIPSTPNATQDCHNIHSLHAKRNAGLLSGGNVGDAAPHPTAQLFTALHALLVPEQRPAAAPTPALWAATDQHRGAQISGPSEVHAEQVTGNGKGVTQPALSTCALVGAGAKAPPTGKRVEEMRVGVDLETGLGGSADADQLRRCLQQLPGISVVEEGSAEAAAAAQLPRASTAAVKVQELCAHVVSALLPFRCVLGLDLYFGGSQSRCDLALNGWLGCTGTIFGVSCS
eukprot:1158656-Pelagomonas_calceolata.AAC.8